MADAQVECQPERISEDEPVRRIGGITVLGTFAERPYMPPQIAVVQQTPKSRFEFPSAQFMGSDEQPEAAARRILLAQTGYGYGDETQPNEDVLKMVGAMGAKRADYSHYLVVMRGVEVRQAEVSVHKLGSISLHKFLSGVQNGSSLLIGAEGAAAFMKAGLNSYRSELRKWLVEGNNEPAADKVRTRLAPWLQWEPSHE